MSTSITDRKPGEAGIALIVTVLLLLLVSALGTAALQNAGNESNVSVNSRRKLTVVYSADSALNLVIGKLTTNSQFPDTTPVDEPSLLTDDGGYPISVRTGDTQTTVPQPVLRVGRTTAPGSQLNINSSNTLSFGVYRAGVVASDSGGGRAQLQAQFIVPEGAAGY